MTNVNAKTVGKMTKIQRRKLSERNLRNRSMKLDLTGRITALSQEIRSTLELISNFAFHLSHIAAIPGLKCDDGLERWPWQS
jgi:hypothetical protein